MDELTEGFALAEGLSLFRSVVLLSPTLRSADLLSVFLLSVVLRSVDLFSGFEAEGT